MNIITIPLKQKWGEEIEHKTFFNIDEDLVNYIKLLEEDIDKYNKELLNQGERIFKAIEYIKTGKTFDDIEVARIIDKYEKNLLNILEKSDKE